MAEEPGKEKEKKKKIVEPKVGAKVRYFDAPHVEYVRMGRTVGTFRGMYGTIDLNKGTMELVGGQTWIGEARMTANRVRLSLGPNTMTAEGKVRLEERGVSLEADSLTASPVLWGIRTGGNVRLKSDSREAAAELLKSHKG